MSDLNISSQSQSSIGGNQGDSNPSSNSRSSNSFSGRNPSFARESLAIFNDHYERARRALESYINLPSAINYTFAESRITQIDRHRREALAAGASEGELGYQSTLEARLQAARREEAIRNQTPEQDLALALFEEFYANAEEALRTYVNRPIRTNHYAAESIIRGIDRRRRAAIAIGVSDFLLGYQSTLQARLNNIFRSAPRYSYVGADLANTAALFNACYCNAVDALKTYEDDSTQANYERAHRQIQTINNARNTAIARGVAEDTLAYQSSLEIRLQRAQRAAHQRLQGPEALEARRDFDAYYERALAALEIAENDPQLGNFTAANELIQDINRRRELALEAGACAVHLRYQSTLEGRLIIARSEAVLSAYETAYNAAQEAVERYISDPSVDNQSAASILLEPLDEMYAQALGLGIEEVQMPNAQALFNRFHTTRRQNQGSVLMQEAEDLLLHIQMQEIERASAMERGQHISTIEEFSAVLDSISSNAPTGKALADMAYGINPIANVIAPSPDQPEEAPMYGAALNTIQDVYGYDRVFNPLGDGNCGISALAYLFSRKMRHDAAFAERFNRRMHSLSQRSYTQSLGARMRSSRDDLLAVFHSNANSNNTHLLAETPLNGIENQDVYNNFINSFRYILWEFMSREPLGLWGGSEQAREQQLAEIRTPGVDISIESLRVLGRILEIEIPVYQIHRNYQSAQNPGGVQLPEDTQAAYGGIANPLSLDERGVAILWMRNHFMVLEHNTVPTTLEDIQPSSGFFPQAGRAALVRLDRPVVVLGDQSQERKKQVQAVQEEQTKAAQKEGQKVSSTEPEKTQQIDPEVRRRQVAAAALRRQAISQLANESATDAITRLLLTQGLALDLNDANNLTDKVLEVEDPDLSLEQKIESILNIRCRGFSARSGCSVEWGTNALNALRSISADTDVPLATLVRVLQIFAEFNGIREIPNARDEIAQFIQDNIRPIVTLASTEQAYDWVSTMPTSGRVSYDEASWDGQARALTWRYFEEDYERQLNIFRSENDSLVGAKMMSRISDLNRLPFIRAQSYQNAFEALTEGRNSPYAAFNRAQRTNPRASGITLDAARILEGNKGINGIQYEVNTTYICNDPYIDTVQMVPLPDLPTIPEWHNIANDIVAAFTHYNPVGSAVYNAQIGAIKTQIGNAGDAPDTPGARWSPWNYGHLHNILKRRIRRLYNEFTKDGLTEDQKRENLANFALALSGYGTDCPDGTNTKLCNYEQANVFKIPQDAHLGVRMSYLLAQDRMNYVENHQDAARGYGSEDGMIGYRQLCLNIHLALGLPGKLSDNPFSATRSYSAPYGNSSVAVRDNPSNVISRYLLGGSWRQERIPRQLPRDPNAGEWELPPIERVYSDHRIEPYTVARMVSLLKAGVAQGTFQSDQVINDAKGNPAVFKAYDEIMEEFDGTGNPYFDFVDNQIVFRDALYHVLLEKYFFISKIN